MPGYSLFDVKKSDARRVVEALTGHEFVGNKLYAEIADPEKDYTHASRRKKEAPSGDGAPRAGKPARRKPAGNYDKFIKKGKNTSKMLVSVEDFITLDIFYGFF